MPEERQSQSGQEPKRRKRRRPLRHRNKHQQKPQANEAVESAPVAADSEKVRRERSERRRRRRAKAERQEYAGPVTPEPQVDDLNFQPPASVFIYTHVIRPAASGGYEFRSDPFSKISRRLEDFHIDLSVLFPEGGEARLTAPKPEPGWAAVFDDDFEEDVEDDLYSELDDEEPDDPTVPSEME